MKAPQWRILEEVMRHGIRKGVSFRRIYAAISERVFRAGR